MRVRGGKTECCLVYIDNSKILFKDKKFALLIK